MVQFYPKAVSKSYRKRMDAESQDVPRGACLTFGGTTVSLLRVNDLDDCVRYRRRGPLSLAAPVLKAYVKKALERAGKFNPDLFVFASTASARVPGSSRSLL
jgi:hypothetical protein